MTARGAALAVVFGALAFALVGCTTSATATRAAQPGAQSGYAGDSVSQSDSLGTAAASSAPASPSAASSPSKSTPGAESPSAAATRGQAAAPATGSATTSAAGTTVAAKGSGLQLSTNSLTDGNVALTFDDGPGAATPQLLALLRQYKIKATFCLVGQEVKAHPDLVRQIVADGHTLCNHTWSHDEHLGNKSADAIRADLQKTNDAINAAVPNAPIVYFRHPGGNFTATAVEVCKSMGMQPIGWTVDPRDWDVPNHKGNPTFTAKIEQTIRANTHAGSIVLSHDGGGDRSSTLAAYGDLLPELQSKFTLVALPTK